MTEPHIPITPHSRTTGPIYAVIFYMIFLGTCLFAISSSPHAATKATPSPHTDIDPIPLTSGIL
jgi:hypothetical protein